LKECSKSILRRLREPNFFRFYFSGDGIDIGGKPDPLALYAQLFPAVRSIRTWDWDDGDAQLMQGVPDGSFDFVHSSHCLEHLADPEEGLRNWFRILKPGGYLIVTVPDEDLYEQGVFPSTFNRDHKTTFTVFKQESWSGVSRNVLDLAQGLGPRARIQKIELLDSSYRYDLPRFDQTLTPVGECGIEFIVHKLAEEVSSLTGRHRNAADPAPELRVHYNQYRLDQQRLRSGNQAEPPFTNTDSL